MAMAVKMSHPNGGVAEPMATCSVMIVPTSTLIKPDRFHDRCENRHQDEDHDDRIDEHAADEESNRDHSEDAIFGPISVNADTGEDLLRHLCE